MLHSYQLIMCSTLAGHLTWPIARLAMYMSGVAWVCCHLLCALGCAIV